MKKIVLVVAATLLLTGCASALTPPEVTATINVTAPTDTLIGDPVKVEATGNLSNKRDDKVVIRVQSSTDGKTWTTIKQATAKGPKVSLTSDLIAKTAGETKYRATISASSTSKAALRTTPEAAASTVTVSDIKDLIRKFYYDRTTAYVQSPAAGAAWDDVTDSPIYDRKAPTYISNSAAEVAANNVDTSVPNLATISPDPKWMLGSSSCNIAMTVPPVGRTFIVTVAFGGSSGGFPVATTNSDVHVTLLNGKLVDYIQTCG